jgi:2'-5' RNA ligase
MSGENSTKVLRVFFALWPAEAERAALATWQQPLRQLCGGRLVPADNVHNTLVFLGEVEFERMEVLQLAAQEVRGAEFQLSYDIPRYWGHNHIVYAAPVTVPAKLMQLVNDLRKKMQQHHFKFDSRAYKPHVTLLRNARWTDSPFPEMPQVIWKMREFVLVQSLSEGQGVRYEVLARFPLL